jgi:SAM-dependent methyltransferase
METYDPVASEYVRHRRPDARIARAIRRALGDIRTLLNVGAGAGSYEPGDVEVIGVEPSLEMSLRRPEGMGRVVEGTAEHLPFRDASFDAAMAVLTVHHWRDPGAGLKEMVRVARERVVIFTWDPDHPGFWLVRDYLPEVLEIDRSIFPSINEVGEHLELTQTVAVPIPWDCTDGFLGAYWRRPYAYLDPDVRRAISTFSRMKDISASLARLRADLLDGAWERTNEALLSLQALDLGYRLLVARGCGGQPRSSR